MNVSAMNAPASKLFSSKRQQQSTEEDSKRPATAEPPPGDPATENGSTNGDSNDEAKPNDLKPPPPSSSDPSDAADASTAQQQREEAAAAAASEIAAAVETEEDEEVRIAMEMALAAAQNPHLSPADLRKLVAEKNKQVAIVDEIQQKKELEKQKERDEANKRWAEKKDRAKSWWHGTAEKVTESVLELRESAGQAAEEIQDRVDRRRYADQIKQDKEYQEIRRKIKIMEKTLKANRLQGNRVETRHAFKRQRQEKKLLELNKKLDKTHKLFIDSSYNVHEYAKAMLRASKKWKKQGSDEELSLEAQLCRNMHQMLAVEKQKSKVKKTSREIKKYLQRCKGWLSEKKAMCEMHMMTLDATNASFVLLYEDTLKRQDALIAKLVESDEFKDVDIDSIELENWKQLSDKTPGPYATLSALRGLPINDSIRMLKKENLVGTGDDRKQKPPPQQGDNRKPPPPGSKQPPPQQQGQKRPELFIETHASDEGSAHSDISDPDADEEEEEGAAGGSVASLDSSGSIDYGNDAPWISSARSSSDLGSVEEEAPEAAAGKAAANILKKGEPDHPRRSKKPDASEGKNHVNGDQPDGVKIEAKAQNDERKSPPKPPAEIGAESKAPKQAPTSSKGMKAPSPTHSAASSTALEYSENDSSLVGNGIIDLHKKGSESNPGYLSDASPTEKPEDGEETNSNPATTSATAASGEEDEE